MILSPRTLVVEIKDALKLWNNDLNHRQKDRIRERGCLGEEGGEQTRELHRKEASTHILSNFLFSLQFSSVQSSRSVVSDSLQPHESQHARPPCPSPTPRVHSNSCL